MLHIMKIHQVLFPFFGIQAHTEVIGKRQQTGNIWGTGRHAFRLGLGGSIKILFSQTIQQILHTVPDFSGLFPFFRRYAVILFGAYPSERQNRKPFIQLLQAFRCRKSVYGIFIRLQCIQIHIRAVRFLTEHPRLIQAVPRFRKHGADIVFQQPHPPAFLQVFRRNRIILFVKFQPFSRPWITHGEFIQSQNLFFQPLFLSRRREIFHTGKKVFPAFRKIILQHLRQDILHEKLDFPVIRHTEIRIQVNFVKMVPDNIKAEAVNGGDLGIMNQRQLLEQMGISRIIIHSGGKSLGNPLPHLGRRRIGKGNHKEPVDIHRMLPVAYHLYDPFHQYRRFSAACRRRYENAAAPGIDGRLLIRCKCHCHVLTPSAFPAAV